MADIVSNTLSTLQNAYSTAKNIADLNEVQAIKSQIGELQTQILAAQESALRSQEREAAMAQEINDLKQRMAELEEWEAEKKRYALTDFGGGTFAYDLKEDMSNGEPPHRICAACYQNGDKSILHFLYDTGSGQQRFKCPSCDTEFDFGVLRPQPPMNAIS